MCLSQSFYANDTVMVAQALLGKKLVRMIDGQALSGMVVETEAYVGVEDSACHAAKGRTARTEVMFGPPGCLPSGKVAYIYIIYGIHFMLNVVTEAEERPCAVLIRGLEPLTGRSYMRQRRSKSDRKLTNGPARLCQALNIDRTLNRWNLTQGQQLWFEDYQVIPPEREHMCSTLCGPRIGIDSACPKDRQAPWRFWIQDNLYVSR